MNGDNRKRSLFRLFEFLPGVLAWGTLIGAIVFSHILPVWTSVFIIVFDTYWFLKTLFFSVHLRSSFTRMRANMRVNWKERLIQENLPWREVYHLVILPMYKEPYELVRETFGSLCAANYPTDRMIVVLATEARAPEGEEAARRIEEEFRGKFFQLLTTAHPSGLPDEIPGKGSNETWAGRQVKEKIIDPLGIPYEKIMVSVFDVDTQVFPEYFGVLTYEFLTCPYPQRSSFQPVPLFTNNIYQAPALARILAFGSTY